MGRNLDAFNDILTWPCDGNDTHYTLIWQNSDLSRERLGYPETIRWLEERVERCHSSNRPQFVERLESAKQGQGQAMFDLLVEIILQNAAYVHLILA